MSQGPFSLDAYLGRIGHAGPADATLATLAELHRLHTQAIPFENLSSLLGEPMPLDRDALHDKLVARRRGGWCFEHNLLFTHVLRELGYDVMTLAARVRWGVPPGHVTARSHMLMRVMLGGAPWIADVGFGGLTLTAPLRLVPHVEQATPHEIHRLAPEGGGYVLQAKVAGEWSALYAFDLHEQLQADYEVSSWYLAHFPQSRFVTGLMAARADGDRRHTLRDNRYSIHHAGGDTERRHLTTVAQVKDVLSGAMRIPLPEHPQLDLRLQGIVEANPVM